MERLTARQLEDRLHALFREPLDDGQLRERFTALDMPHHHRHALVAVWGPPLYRRNRAMFLPLILMHFQGWYGGVPSWRGKYQEALEQWLAEADRNGDVELFRRLYQWKLHSTCWRPTRAWRKELVERFRGASRPHEREEVLKKFDFGYPLDDETAVALYDIDAATARPFLATRVQVHARKGVPGELRQRARQAGDEQLYGQLYRQQASTQEWRADARSLCESVADPAELCRRLEGRHPALDGREVGDVFLELAGLRGADVLPYLQAHLAGFGWTRDAWYPALRDLAQERGWREFHGALVRACGNHQEFQATVTGALADRSVSDEEAIERLYALTGAGPQSRPLDEATALALYRRFPDLARGPLRPLIVLPGASKDHALLREVLAAGDELMIDHLATQAVVGSGRGEDVLADHYAALRDSPEEFARRAVAVLSQMPAYSFEDRGYRRPIRTNRLARLLLERSAELQLANAALLRDMLESPGIFVQVLALRALARDDDRARQAAGENLDLLLPMLLRPLHRRTRLLAFQALANAATTEDRARLLLGRARDALELPDPNYPREQLIGLLGRVLARWPGLRQERERPVVYGETPT
jgi:hypothetical protein